MKRVNRKILLVIGVLLIAALVMGACGKKATPTKAPTPTQAPTAAPTPSTAQSSTSSEDPDAAQKPTGKFEGAPVGFTKGGDPYWGKPDAPVTIIEYSDYQCPFCGRHESQTAPKIQEQYIKTGVARLIFKDMPLTQIHPNAMNAAEAANCAADQGAEKFWAMNRKLFSSQQEWSRQKDPSATFEKYAKEIGLDTNKFEKCYKSKAHQNDIMKDEKEAASRGLNGTPSFWINGRIVSGAYPFSKFQSVIEDAKVHPTPQPTPTLTNAQRDPYGVDPDKPGFTYDGSVTKGEPGAPMLLVIQDFGTKTDLEFATKVLPELEKKYVDTGKLRLVFNFYPATAPKEALAAECAAQQGADAFWKFYEKLFEKQSEWKAQGADEYKLMKGYAKEIGLDTEKFNDCVDHAKGMDKVKLDYQRDQYLRVNNTPYLFVISPDYRQGQRLGTATLEEYEKEIDAWLATQK